MLKTLFESSSIEDEKINSIKNILQNKELKLEYFELESIIKNIDLLYRILETKCSETENKNLFNILKKIELHLGNTQIERLKEIKKKVINHSLDSNQFHNIIIELLNEKEIIEHFSYPDVINNNRGKQRLRKLLIVNQEIEDKVKDEIIKNKNIIKTDSLKKILKDKDGYYKDFILNININDKMKGTIDERVFLENVFLDENVDLSLLIETSLLESKSSIALFLLSKAKEFYFPLDYKALLGSLLSKDKNLEEYNKLLLIHKKMSIDFSIPIDGKTPLIHALKANKNKLAYSLCITQPNLNLGFTSTEGTALDLAKKNNNFEVVSFIRSKGYYVDKDLARKCLHSFIKERNFEQTINLLKYNKNELVYENDIFGGIKKEEIEWMINNALAREEHDFIYAFQSRGIILSEEQYAKLLNTLISKNNKKEIAYSLQDIMRKNQESKTFLLKNIKSIQQKMGDEACIEILLHMNFSSTEEAKKILEIYEETDISFSQSIYNSTLFMLANQYNPQLAYALIETEKDLNINYSSEGNTALSIAIKQKLPAEHISNIILHEKTMISFHKQALLEAIVSDNIEIIDLLQGVEVSEESIKNYFLDAVKKNNRQAISALIKNYQSNIIDIIKKDGTNINELFFYLINNMDYVTIDFLYSKGLMVDSYFAKNLLAQAIEKNNLTAFYYLIKIGGLNEKNLWEKEFLFKKESLLSFVEMASKTNNFQLIPSILEKIKNENIPISYNFALQNLFYLNTSQEEFEKILYAYNGFGLKFDESIQNKTPLIHALEHKTNLAYALSSTQTFLNINYISKEGTALSMAVKKRLPLNFIQFLMYYKFAFPVINDDVALKEAIKIGYKEAALLLKSAGSNLKTETLEKLFIDAFFDQNIPSLSTLFALIEKETLNKPSFIEKLKEIEIKPNFFSQLLQSEEIELTKYLYENGLISTSHASLYKLLRDSEVEKSHHKVELLSQLRGTNQGSIFASQDEFKKASMYVYKNFLVKPYNNGSSEWRWGNQRSIVYFDDASIISVPKKYIIGVSEAIELSSQSPSDKSLKEIAIETGIPEEKIGTIDIKSLENDFGKKVKKIAHRPNHDITHTIRTAAHIEPYIKLSQKNFTSSEVEKLQLMMLFSVIGREDETGFNDAKKANKFYTSYRAVSAIEFLKYVLDNWDTYYSKVFENKKDLYLCALTVELMGFPSFLSAESDKENFILYHLMQGEGNISKIQNIIKNNGKSNILKGYTDQDFFKICSKEKIDPSENSALITNKLSAMNFAHAMDLLRCYHPDDYNLLQDTGGNSNSLFSICYQLTYRYLCRENLDKKLSPVEMAIEYLQYTQSMLEHFGEKQATQLSFSEPVIENAIAIEKFLFNHINKKWAELKHEPIFLFGETKPIAFKTLVEQLELKEEIKKQVKMNEDSNLPITHTEISIFLNKYIVKNALSKGDYEIKKERFDFFNYFTQTEIGRKGRKQDLNEIMNRNLWKDIDKSITTINNISRPDELLVSPLSSIDYEIENHIKEKIRKHCQDGVFVKKENKDVIIEFLNEDSLKKVMELLYQFTVIDRKWEYFINKENNAAYTKLSEEQYAYIYPYLKFRKITPPKIHSLENKIVDIEKGEIDVLNLIKQCEATCSVHNTVSTSEQKSGFEFYCNTLENPSSDRSKSVKKTQLTKEERSVVYDLKTVKNKKIEKIKRTLVDPIDIENQEPIMSNPSDYEYEAPREVAWQRGADKNSIFNKKNAQTLLAPDAYMQLFQGWPSYLTYFPVGFVFDLKDLHLHGEKYIFEKNVVSNEKFWIKGSVSENILKNKKSIPLKELQEKLKTFTEDDIHDWNELLAGNSKTSMRALLCPGLDFCDDNAPLSYKLNLFMQSKHIKDKFNIEVPMIISEKNHPSYLYTETLLLNDIKEAYNAIKNDVYPYINNYKSENNDFIEKIKDRWNTEKPRLLCEEQAIIIDFFETLTNNKCEAKLIHYPIPGAYRKIDESYESYTQRCDQYNTDVLKSYLESLKLDELKIKKHIDDLNIMGYEKREAALLENSLSCHPIDDVDNIKNLFIRNILLGNTEVVKKILSHIKENNIKIDFQSLFAHHDNVFEFIESIRNKHPHHAIERSLNNIKQQIENHITADLNKDQVKNRYFASNMRNKINDVPELIETIKINKNNEVCIAQLFKFKEKNYLSIIDEVEKKCLLNTEKFDLQTFFFEEKSYKVYKVSSPDLKKALDEYQRQDNTKPSLPKK